MTYFIVIENMINKMYVVENDQIYYCFYHRLLRLRFFQLFFVFKNYQKQDLYEKQIRGCDILHSYFPAAPEVSTKEVARPGCTAVPALRGFKA